MNKEWVRRYCMALPHTTETVQWGDNLVLKVGGKMYALVNLDPAENWLAFKCDEEDFADLVERPDIIPAPYLARAQWVALQSEEVLSTSELKTYLRKAYDLVFAKLTQKQQAELTSAKPAAHKRPAKKKATSPRR